MIGIINLLVFQLILPKVARGQNNFYFSVGFFQELNYPKSFLTTTDVGVLLKINNRLSTGAEINLNRFWKNDKTFLGLGLKPQLAFSVIQKKTYHFILEAKGGVNCILQEDRDEAINFTFLIGSCFEFHRKEVNKIRIGFYYNYFDDGKRIGHLKKSDWKGLGLTLSYLFK